jgi:hypothetical protein
MGKMLIAGLVLGLTGVAACTTSTATEASETNVGADDFYSSVKRALDTLEGHPPKPDTMADLDMAGAIGYLAGAWDGMKLAAELRKPGSAACMSAPTQVAGMARIVVRYVDNHPQAHGGNRFTVVGSAFLDAYPCLR